jgi:hypothetical protein
VDSLFGNTNNFTVKSEEHLEIIEFLKLVLRTIVTYLKKLQELVPVFREAIIEDELWLVCPQHALAKSFKEIFDLLRKFFGGCNRSIRHYCLYDVN